MAFSTLQLGNEKINTKRAREMPPDLVCLVSGHGEGGYEHRKDFIPHPV